MKHARGALRAKKQVTKKQVNKERDEDAKKSRLRFSTFDKFWAGVNMVLKVQKSEVDEEFLSIIQAQESKVVVEITVIMPHDPYKIGWDLFLGGVIFYSVLTVPLQIGFQLEPTAIGDIVEYNVNCLFALDMILNFNTAYIDAASKLVYRRYDIAKKYMQMWFWIDLVSTFPYDLISGMATGVATLRLVKIFRLLRLLKLVRLLKLSKLGKQFDALQINPALLSIISLIVQLLLVAHLMACFWFFMTTVNVTGDSTAFTWLHYVGMEDASLTDKYVISFYWCITTILSIGYGDIIPVSTSERIFCIATELCGGIIFGAVISQVTRLIETRNPGQRAYKAKMDELKAYLDEKLLPRSLKTKAKNAYMYYLLRKSSFAESGIFDDLPKDMLGKLINNIYSKEINGITMFREYNQRFVIQLVMNSQPSQASQGDLICNYGDVADEFHFLLHGVVRMTVQRDGSFVVIAGYSSDTGYIGDFEYTKRSTRIADYTAVLSCSIISVSYDIVADLATEHSDAFEQFDEESKGRYERFSDVLNLPYSRHLHKRHLADELVHAVKDLPHMHLGDDVEDSLYEFEAMWIDGRIEKNDGRFSQTELSKELLHTSKATYRVLIINDQNPLMPTQLKDMTQDDFNRLGVIHPGHYIKTAWDLFVGVLIVYSVLTVPVQIAFGTESDALADWCFNGLFFIDMCFGFRTAYHDDDEDAFIISVKQITSRYLRSWFVIDFVSFFPFDVVLEFFMKSATSGLSSIKLLKTIRLIRLVRLVRLAKLGHYLSKIEDQIGLSPAVFNLMNMLTQVMFIAHMVACIWWGLCINFASVGWMNDVLGRNMRDAPVRDQYITALYWTTTTLATVGYGEITAANTYERYLNIVVMILGATIFGYIVANVSNQMNSMNQASARLVEKVSEVVEYLNEKNCPKLLSSSIVRHFKNKFSHQSVYDEVGILGRLPVRLHHEIKMFQYKEILSKIPIFRHLSNKSIAIYVFNLLDMSYYETGQYLIRQNEVGNDLCFITDGSAHVYKRIANKKKKKKPAPKPTGSLQFLKRQGSVIANKLDPGIQMKLLKMNMKEKLGHDGGVADENNFLDEKPDEIVVRTTHESMHVRTPTWEQYEAAEEKVKKRGGIFLGNVGTGDFVGHVALMTHTRHAASVVASTSCTVYLLSRADVGKICHEHRDISLSLQSAIGKSVRVLEDRLGKLHVRTKRAAFLYSLRKSYHVHQNERNEARKKMAQSLTRAVTRQSTKLVATLNKVKSSHFTNLSSKVGSKVSNGNAASNEEEEVSTSSKTKPNIIVPWYKQAVFEILLYFGFWSLHDYKRATGYSDMSMSHRLLEKKVSKLEKKYMSPSRRRWELIREAIINAKAEAVVMRMKEAAKVAENALMLESRQMNMPTRSQSLKQSEEGIALEETTKAAPSGGHGMLDQSYLSGDRGFTPSKSRNIDFFIRALRSKVGATVLGAAFKDSNLAYDSDEDKIPFEKIAVTARSLRRTNSSPWLVNDDPLANMARGRAVGQLKDSQNHKLYERSVKIYNEVRAKNKESSSSSSSSDTTSKAHSPNLFLSSSHASQPEGTAPTELPIAEAEVSSDEDTERYQLEHHAEEMQVSSTSDSDSNKSSQSSTSSIGDKRGGVVAPLNVIGGDPPASGMQNCSETDEIRKPREECKEEAQYSQNQNNEVSSFRTIPLLVSGPIENVPGPVGDGTKDKSNKFENPADYYIRSQESDGKVRAPMLKFHRQNAGSSKARLCLSSPRKGTKPDPTKMKRQRRYSFPSCNVATYWVKDNKDQLVV